MNKSELVSTIARRTEMSEKDVNAVLGEFITVVGDKLTIPGFISFEQTERKARMGRNPQTGEQIQVPATKAVKISAGSKLKKIAKGEETP